MTGIPEFFRLIESTQPSSSARPGCLQPLYIPSVRREVVSSLLGSTTARAVEVAAVLDQLLIAQEGRAEAGRRSAQKKAAAHAPKVDAAVAAALGHLDRSRQSRMFRHTPTVLQKAIRALGPKRFGLADEPGLEAIRQSLERYASRKDHATVPSCNPEPDVEG